MPYKFLIKKRNMQDSKELVHRPRLHMMKAAAILPGGIQVSWNPCRAGRGCWTMCRAMGHLPYCLPLQRTTGATRASAPPKRCNPGTNGSSHDCALECSRDDVLCVINLIWTTLPPLSSLGSSVCFLKISPSISFLPVTTTIWNSFLFL